MTPITHRNREIERLERELAESREECRRLREALEKIAYHTSHDNSLHTLIYTWDTVTEQNHCIYCGAPEYQPHKEDKRECACRLLQDAYNALEQAAALAPKAGGK